MEQYWDCSLCRIEDKGNAFRCRRSWGKLKGADRLLREVADARKVRPRASVLSSFAAGLGQIYARRWSTGLLFALIIPLAVGLVWSVWQGFTYGHLFLVGAGVFVLVVAHVHASLMAGPLEPGCGRDEAATPMLDGITPPPAGARRATPDDVE